MKDFVFLDFFFFLEDFFAPSVMPAVTAVPAERVSASDDSGASSASTANDISTVSKKHIARLNLTKYYPSPDDRKYNITFKHTYTIIPKGETVIKYSVEYTCRVGIS